MVVLFLKHMVCSFACFFGNFPLMSLCKVSMTTVPQITYELLIDTSTHMYLALIALWHVIRINPFEYGQHIHRAITLLAFLYWLAILFVASIIITTDCSCHTRMNSGRTKTFNAINGVCVSLCDGSFLPLWATSAWASKFPCGNIVIGSLAFECECERRLSGVGDAGTEWVKILYWLEKNPATCLLHPWKTISI